jgi:tRNA threonylcarbamoyladenosine biosynthesis protein TsaB
MKLLAIDTANWPLGVALADGERLLGEINTYITKNHSLRLMPAIEHLFEQLDWEPSMLEGIVVADGPGSYTGVRIGVTAAKTLAWSLKLPLLGISSLQHHAQTVGSSMMLGVTVPLIDARRDNVYAGIYQWHMQQQVMWPKEPDQHLHIEKLITLCSQYHGPFMFTGNGVALHEEKLKSYFKDKAFFAPTGLQVPRAAALLELGRVSWLEAVDDVHRFKPRYLQMAEAEAKWIATQEAGQNDDE